VNVWGVVNGIRAFVPRMLAGGEEGHVVNTASMAGVVTGGIGTSPYDTSKHAVVALTESLYRELALNGAKVSASVLCPGYVNTPIYHNSLREQPDAATAPSLREETPDIGATPGVFTPDYVAGQVLEAIREDRFYIFAAQSEIGGWVKMRHDRMMDGKNPAVPRRSAGIDRLRG
jgi:NAD(P)-dependent dehydrogenase (short-subunit alcohol dehydrogenase family)